MFFGQETLLFSEKWYHSKRKKEKRKFFRMSKEISEIWENLSPA